MNRRFQYRGLYLLTDEPLLADDGFLNFLRSALKAGLRMVQLRAKSFSSEAQEAIGHKMRELTRIYDACLIVNDDPHLALRVRADGVHVGQGDLSAAQVRNIVGPKMIVGLSTHNRDQIVQAAREPVDYIGVGPVYGTQTKADAGEAVGLELLAWAQTATDLPTVAIGGITLDNLLPVLCTGTANYAVISDIGRNQDPLGRVKAHIKAMAEYDNAL